ncbi:MAG: plasmid mobilization relaxosome protein MobC [Bacteroidales bacterium]
MERKNPKGGRPQKSEDEKKTKRFTVHLTDDEAEKIQEKARRMNLSVSQFLKESAHKTKLIEPDPSRVKLLSELAKIGSNLNQIAKKINQSSSLSENEKEGLNQIYLKFKEIKESLY